MVPTTKNFPANSGLDVLGGDLFRTWNTTETPEGEVLHVPFFPLDRVNGSIRKEIEVEIAKVINNSQYILGENTQAFEKEWASFCGAKECVAVGNGLDALFLTLRSFEIGPGDEVLVPSNTFIATWFAVSNCGATPIPVPPRADTFNIDPKRIAEKITSRTRAVIAVHLYGHPAELREINDTARDAGILVIEDAAQAHGARYLRSRIGSHGNAACWSFYPGKNLGALGDGGAITTDNEALADKLRVLRNYGSRVKYQHQVIGFNSRLDEIQAAVLRVKLRYLDEWNFRRQAVAGQYSEKFLSELSNLSEFVKFPTVLEESEPVWHQYVMRTPYRDYVAHQLRKRGIETMVHYPTDPIWQEAYSSKDMPREDVLLKNSGDRLLSLPISPALVDEEINHVISSVVDVFRGLAKTEKSTLVNGLL